MIIQLDTKKNLILRNSDNKVLFELNAETQAVDDYDLIITKESKDPANHKFIYNSGEYEIKDFFVYAWKSQKEYINLAAIQNRGTTALIFDGATNKDAMKLAEIAGGIDILVFNTTTDLDKSTEELDELISELEPYTVIFLGENIEALKQKVTKLGLNIKEETSKYKFDRKNINENSSTEVYILDK